MYMNNELADLSGDVDVKFVLRKEYKHPLNVFTIGRGQTNPKLFGIMS